MSINEVADSIAYCGLVCKLCHLADTCDGCKSENNCCGRRLSPGVATSTIVVDLTGVGNVMIFAVEKICFQIRMTLGLELLCVV